MNSIFKNLFEYADQQGFAKGNFRTDDLIKILEHHDLSVDEYVTYNLLENTIDDVRNTEDDSGYLDSDMFDSCLGYIFLQIEERLKPHKRVMTARAF